MEENKLIKKVWDYLVVRDKLEKVDAILVLGSKEMSPAIYGCELFLQGFADYIIFTGGVPFDESKTEAEKYLGVALEMGIPKEKIILENKATNTGENFSCTKELLKNLGYNFDSFIVVQKPYMMRRSYATGKIHLPDTKLLLSCQDISFENFLHESPLTKERIVSSMVGDLQRIKYYPEKGFQIYQEITDDVWQAGVELVKLGYSKRPVT